jgi:hypothetical protein
MPRGSSAIRGSSMSYCPPYASGSSRFHLDERIDATTRVF